MYSINNISLQFSGTYILKDVSLVINKKSRIGLVGKNGAGKTTLLRILAGVLQPDSGSVSLPENTTIGFLPQEILLTGNQTVFSEALKTFDKILALKEIIQNSQDALTQLEENNTTEAYETHVQRLYDANEEFAISGGHEIEAETEKVLLGLGFTSEQLHQNITTFSGGWRMRVELAKILLKKPDLLLLDEPTNHLDIESIQWFEDFLNKYHGAVIIVSHDRTFLDNATNRTVEINLGSIYDYDTHYSDYIIKRDERIAHQISAYENQQKYIEHTEKFIERFRYKATKAKQVQSKIKTLDKLEKVEVDFIDNSSIYFKFPSAPASGKVVVEAQSLYKSFENKKVLENIDFLINKGEKIAFVGKNGEGKTTLSRIITGELEHDGKCTLGYNVSLGYYAQNETELLEGEKTVFETIDDVATGDVRTKIRQILGSFLFSGDTIEKKVKVLSGGEKSRLALARLLLKPVNLLVLDEPTNHLDMKAKDILKQALMAYNGTLIIVSHDRHFLQDLTNKVFEFKNRAIRQYNGDVNDFLKSRKIENLRVLEHTRKSQKQTPTQKEVPFHQSLREKNKALEREIRKTENTITTLEISVEKTETRLAEIEKSLENPDITLSNDMYKALSEEYKTLKSEHDLLIEEWSALHHTLDELLKQKQNLQ